MTGLIRIVSEYTWGNPELERLRRYGEMKVISTSTKRARDLDDSRCSLDVIFLRGLELAESYPETSRGSFNIVERIERI
jgi:hypothetical protein